jgi:hypothetical protein
MTNTFNTLASCPFCGTGGQTKIHENHLSPTMSGGEREPISVDVTHWCMGEGLPRTIIKITGRGRQSAINAWNKRVE